MQIIKGNFISKTELEIVNKFRNLDERGKAAVMSQLNHEYVETQKERREANV